MRIRIGAVSLILISLSLVDAASGQKKTRTEEEAQQAETAVDNLKTWDSIYAFYKRFGHCDDGAIADGVSDDVAGLLANHWDSFGEFVKIGNGNRGFESFVLRHVDMSIDWTDELKIKQNAQLHCPSGAEKLCSILIEKITAAQHSRKELEHLVPMKFRPPNR